jgi:cytochrome c-type biogenesis protein
MIKRNSKLIFIILIFLVLMLSGCTQNKNVNNSNQNQDTGEDFKFVSVNGSFINLSDFRGKVIVMDLWTTWCQPCQIQMVDLEKLYDSYSRDDLEIFSINIDSRESIQVILDFIEAFRDLGYNLNWIFGNDNGSIWEKYQISGQIPTLYIFDKNGNIYYGKEAYHSQSALAEKIDELL